MKEKITINLTIQAPPKGFVHGVIPEKGDHYCVFDAGGDTWRSPAMSLNGTGHNLPAWRYATKKLDVMKELMDKVEAELRLCLPRFKGWVTVDFEFSVYAFTSVPVARDCGWRQGFSDEGIHVDSAIGFELTNMDVEDFEWMAAIREIK